MYQIVFWFCVYLVVLSLMFSGLPVLFGYIRARQQRKRKQPKYIGVLSFDRKCLTLHDSKEMRKKYKRMLKNRKFAEGAI